MQDHGYWVGCARSVELTIEGQQLVAQELAREVRALWRRAMLFGRGRRLPPV